MVQCLLFSPRYQNPSLSLLTNTQYQSLVFNYISILIIFRVFWCVFLGVFFLFLMTYFLLYASIEFIHTGSDIDIESYFFLLQKTSSRLIFIHVQMSPNYLRNIVKIDLFSVNVF